MDSKAPLLPHTVAAVQQDTNATQDATAARRRIHTTRLQLAVVAILLSLCWVARAWTCKHKHLEQVVSTKVPLDVHIMSKCPDARDCFQQLVVPVMSNVSSKVDFRLSFIGRVTNEDDGVQCPHGQTECLGDILMLCAASEYPDPKLYLGFSNCLISDYKEIPSKSLVEDCALEHGLDFDVLNDCMSKDSGGYGMGLLRDSVQHSRDVNVSTSCTIRLDGKVRCVYDGGVTHCHGGEKPEDLIHDIEKLYNEAQGWTY